MRLGVLGGSFNPPHIGHLVIASDAFESLELDKLLVVPAALNPLKQHDKTAPTPHERLEMARMTFGGDPRFEVSAMEIERGGLSYTVDTLEALAAENPEAEIVLLLGVDAVKSLDRWKKPERIRELASLAMLSRGDDDLDVPRDVKRVTTRRIDVSSTEIRERLGKGLPVRGFVAESVERFISAAKLYGSPAAAGSGERGNGNA
ncbi:MAG TPA: nicotinate-nucleotide adenylyltransferase [Gemmatimonadaceae bacterium]|nr:nicotinate-nucleotide adenylyltransferase [Gemmatimonadaceae bacterium]